MKPTKKEIGNELMETAKHYPAVPLTDDNVEVFNREGFIIRCKPSSTAIIRIAKRYLRGGIRTSIPNTKIGKSQRPAQSVIDTFIDDGEIENAINYAEVRGVPIYWASIGAGRVLISRCKVVKEGFVLGMVNGEWSITHLKSGKKAAAGDDKAAVLKRWTTNLSDTRLQRLCDAAACNFQGV